MSPRRAAATAQANRKKMTVNVTPTGDPVIVDKARMRKPRYDMFLLAVGALPQPVEFFVIPQGRPGSGFATKTYVHTNGELVNALEKNVAVNIEQIKVSITPVGEARNGDAVMNKIRAMWEDSYLRFEVNEVLELQLQLKDFASGAGLTGVPPMNLVAPVTYLAPAPTVRSIRLLARKIPVPARTHFKMEMFFNTNNAFLTAAIVQGEEIAIRVSLFGRTTRSMD